MNIEKHALFQEVSKSKVEGLPRSHKATNKCGPGKVRTFNN